MAAETRKCGGPVECHYATQYEHLCLLRGAPQVQLVDKSFSSVRLCRPSETEPERAQLEVITYLPKGINAPTDRARTARQLFLQQFTSIEQTKTMAPSLDANASTTYGDWRDEFYSKGYVVLKNVIPRARALKYRQKALDWLSSFPTKFDINDRSTWASENLPQSFKAGMYLHYCAGHEKYVWDARL